MFHRMRVVFGAVMAGVLIALPALAGTGWDLRVDVNDDGKAIQAQVKLDSSHLRAMAVGGDEEIILTEESITMVSHGEKSYMVIPFAMIEQMMGGMMQMAEGMKEAQIAQLKAALDGMPEDQRAEVEKQIAALEKGSGKGSDQPKDTFELKATGQSAEVAGLKTKHYDVIKNGGKVGDAWFTTEIEFGLFQSLFDRFAKMLPEGSTEGLDEFFSLLDQGDGVPVKLTSTEKGKNEFAFVVTSATRVDLAEKDFKPDTSYKMKSMMEGLKTGDDSEGGGW